MHLNYKNKAAQHNCVSQLLYENELRQEIKKIWTKLSTDFQIIVTVYVMSTVLLHSFSKVLWTAYIFDSSRPAPKENNEIGKMIKIISCSDKHFIVLFTYAAKPISISKAGNTNYKKLVFYSKFVWKTQ